MEEKIFKNYNLLHSNTCYFQYSSVQKWILQNVIYFSTILSIYFLFFYVILDHQFPHSPIFPQGKSQKPQSQQVDFIVK